MGAHSLGGAQPINSGYAGKWTGPQNPGFNELYYLNMVNTTNVWTDVVSNHLIITILVYHLFAKQ